MVDRLGTFLSIVSTVALCPGPHTGRAPQGGGASKGAGPPWSLPRFTTLPGPYGTQASGESRGTPATFKHYPTTGSYADSTPGGSHTPLQEVEETHPVFFAETSDVGNMHTTQSV